MKQGGKNCWLFINTCVLFFKLRQTCRISQLKSRHYSSVAVCDREMKTTKFAYAIYERHRISLGERLIRPTLFCVRWDPSQSPIKNKHLWNSNGNPQTKRDVDHQSKDGLGGGGGP